MDIETEILKKWGYRDGFDFRNRFDLKTRYKDYEISTVDLGLDHSFGIGEPLYYETMIFGLNDEYEYMERYSTQEEAIKGHIKAIEYVMNIKE